MSTLRKLRRTMGTRHRFGELPKPLGKIADLPEDERRLVRYLITHWLERDNPQQIMGVSLDAAAQAIEELIDMGAAKIVVDKSPESLANPEGSRYTILPTGKY